MTSYYNEHDAYAAQWLRNLIQAGQIAPGIVDERSIEDVLPSDLRGFTQCHFFAGIGVWSHALRSAGWSDDRPVWTGSCPCQPFSAAGQGAGFDDERHLWPAFQHLIKECRPATVFGEQVASKDSDPWINLVCTDLEALGYFFGAIPFPASGVGAPHIRDRLYWVANADRSARGKGRANFRGRADGSHAQPWAGSGGGLLFGRLADTPSARPQGGQQRGQRVDAQRATAERNGASCRVDDASGIGRCASGHIDASHDGQQLAAASEIQLCGLADSSRPRQRVIGWRGCHCTGHPRAHADQHNDAHATGPTHGFWSAADWLLCRDGRWRPVESGTFPLVDGSAKGVGRSRADWHAPAGKEGQGHRAGRLKGYGNAICAPAAEAFIRCVMEVSL